MMTLLSPALSHPHRPLAGRLPSVQAAHAGLDALDDGVATFRDGRQRAVLEVCGAHFGLLEAEAQDATLAGFAAFLDSLDFPIQILVRVLPADLDRRAQE